MDEIKQGLKVEISKNLEKGVYRPFKDKGPINPNNQLNMLTEKAHEELKSLPIELLQRGYYQPRREFHSQQLQELTESIKANGIIQPIVVRLICSNRYEIIAGERRWRAAQLAGFTEIPCLIKQLSNEQAAILAIIENIQREDLNPIEEALSYEKFHEEFHYKDEEIALKLGKSRTTITHMRRLLNLEAQIQELLIKGELSLGHGKVLASQPRSLQLRLANQTKINGWSVRKLEAEIKKALAQEQNESVSIKQTKDADLSAFERALSDHIGCPVTIKDNQGKGCLIINYSNPEVLEGFLEKLKFKLE